MAVALLLDEHIPLPLANALRTHQIDTVHLIEASWRGVSDEELLTRATTQRRAVVTADVRDFLRLADAWGRLGRRHAGIVLVPQPLPIGELLRRIVARLADWELTPLADRIEVLSKKPVPNPSE